MWPKTLLILIIWVILQVNCFPTNNVVKINTADNIEALNDLDEDDSAELYSGHFQGDMILSREQMQAIQIGDRNGMLDKKYKWPNGIVPFLIEKSHFNPGQIEQISTAMKKIENVSCVRFVPYNPEFHVDYIHVQGDQDGCFSEVGCQHSTSQKFNVQRTYKVNKGCFVLFSIVHELLHALGFHHMQSASDRNDYIRVNEQNIMEGFKQNFISYPASFITNYGVEYDYGSVMHYSNKAFSFDHKSLTIEPKKFLKDEIMGQRDHMTEKDILRLNRAYCNNTITSTTVTPTSTAVTPTTSTIPNNEVTTSMANSFFNNSMNSIVCSKILKNVMWNIFGFLTVVHIIYKIN